MKNLGVKKIWINCGELSGDIQSAEIVKALKETGADLEFVGMGGDNLKNQGVRTLFHINELSVMGISEVLEALPRIFRLLKRIKQALIQEKPDAVIVTDAPDFNFRIIGMAKKLGIPVYYFIPPKVWAWRKYRLNFLKKNVKKIYSILPFEVDFYQKNSVAIKYIGNPLVQVVDSKKYQDVEEIPARIGLMPGSRKKEVSALLPVFSEMADKMVQNNSHYEFYLIKAPHVSEEYLRSFWKSSVPLNFVEPENRYAVLSSCELVVGASGTAILETALLGRPTIVTYKVNPFSFLIGRLFVHVRFVSLPNLILGKELFPELLQGNLSASRLAEIAGTWHNHSVIREEIKKGCRIVQEKLGDQASAKRFAEDFIRELI